MPKSPEKKEGRDVNAQIVPIGGDSPAVTVILEDIERRMYPHAEAVSSMLASDRRWRFLGLGTSVVLAAIATTEASEIVFPLISSDLTPLNHYLILDHSIKSLIENPWTASTLATIGLVGTGILTMRERLRFRKIRTELTHHPLSPIDHHEPPTT
jgi:hypothetical protein